jgi:hypothetical protein
MPSHSHEPVMNARWEVERPEEQGAQQKQKQPSQGPDKIDKPRHIWLTTWPRNKRPRDRRTVNTLPLSCHSQVSLSPISIERLQHRQRKAVPTLGGGSLCRGESRRAISGFPDSNSTGRANGSALEPDKAKQLNVQLNFPWPFPWH